MRKINVLGTEYTVELLTANTDPVLKRCDGYCDKTSKRIVVADGAESDLDNFEIYQKKCIRHEIIHAFLVESGLCENFEHKQFGHDETYVDWIAYQFPKLLQAFKEADAL